MILAAIVDSLYREMIEAKDPHNRKEHQKKEHHKDHHKKHDKQQTETSSEKAPASEKAPTEPAPEKGKKGKKYWRVFVSNKHGSFFLFVIHWNRYRLPSLRADETGDERNGDTQDT